MRTIIPAAASLLFSAAGGIYAIAPGLSRLLSPLVPLCWLKSLIFLVAARPPELQASTGALGVFLALLAGPLAVLCLACIFKVVVLATPKSVMARKTLQVCVSASILVLTNYAFFMQLQYPDLPLKSPDLSAGVGYAVLLLAIALPLLAVLLALLVEGATNPERRMR